jgi:hypothetical protein
VGLDLLANFLRLTGAEGSRPAWAADAEEAGDAE